MSFSLERRCKIFQKKLEQNLMIADTQIQQLTEYYTSLQAQNTEISDQITRLDNQYQQKLNIKHGKEIKRRAKLKARLADDKSQYRKEIAELKEAQSLQLQELQDYFEKSLKQLQDADTKEIKDIDNKYNKIIEELEKKLAKTEEEITEMHNETVDEQSNKIFDNQIQELQNVLAEKNQERVNNLLSSKEKLLDCITSLEENEKEHKLNMDSLREKLTKNESVYKEAVQSLKDEYAKTVSSLKKKIQEKEIEYRKVRKQIHDFKADSTQTMNNLAVTFEKYKQDISHYSKTKQQTVVNYDTDVVDTDTKTIELRKVVRQKEEILNKEQELNSEFKREICRLRFERRIAKKRASLKL